MCDLWKSHHALCSRQFHVLVNNHLKVIKIVPHSNSTVSGTIRDVSCNTECELIKQIKSSQGFDMLIDESTDVASLSLSLTFVRYIYNSQVEEKMFMCRSLPTHTVREDIFYLTGLYVAEKGLSWKQCVDVCTDGAQLIVGKICDFIAHVKALVSECTSSHYIIHHQALAVKKTPNARKWFYMRL
jgi:hypothetical protein